MGVWERGRLVSAQTDTVLGDSSVPVVGTADRIAELNRLVEPFDVNDNPLLVIGGGKVGQAAMRALRRRGVPATS